MNAHTIPAADRAVARSDNRPPTLIELARETYRSLSAWLKEFPAITSHDEAKAAGKWIESVSAAVSELEAERKAKVDPLNQAVRAINDEYRAPRDHLTKLLDEAKRRLTAYAVAEEQRKAAEAEQLRQEAEQARQAAIEAEWAEEDAKAEVDLGICDVDVGAAIETADTAFGEFQKADRQALRAERAIPTRIASSFGGRALTMRNRETLILDDACAALKAIGVTEKISAAILSAARDYRKLNGALPDGVRSETERKL